MAIKKKVTGGDRAAKSFSRGMVVRGDAVGIEATFRSDEEPRREVQKTTIDFDKELYRALKLHSVMTGSSIRDLVHDYVRAGLDEAGAGVEGIPESGRASKGADK